MLIGISGKAFSGKDTFAKFLAEALYNKYGRPFILMAFATELKRTARRDFDLSYEQLWGGSKEEQDFRYPKDEGFWTPREILQQASNYYRGVDSNFWINKVFTLIDEKKYNDVIITDCRFINEINKVKNRNGVLIKVINSNTSSKHGEHESETEQDNYGKYDIHVDNSGSLATLKEKAFNVVEHKLFIKEKIKCVKLDLIIG